MSPLVSLLTDRTQTLLTDRPQSSQIPSREAPRYQACLP